jgi:hypothetical protein
MSGCGAESKCYVLTEKMKVCSDYADSKRYGVTEDERLQPISYDADAAGSGMW